LYLWLQKKNFTVEDQIRKECRIRGLPEPVNFERLESIQVRSRARPAPATVPIKGKELKPFTSTAFATSAD
jgi:hypothetical protein